MNNSTNNNSWLDRILSVFKNYSLSPISNQTDYATKEDRPSFAAPSKIIEKWGLWTLFFVLLALIMLTGDFILSTLFIIGMTILYLIGETILNQRTPINNNSYEISEENLYSSENENGTPKQSGGKRVKSQLVTRPRGCKKKGRGNSSSQKQLPPYSNESHSSLSESSLSDPSLSHSSLSQDSKSSSTKSKLKPFNDDTTTSSEKSLTNLQFV